MNTQYASPRLSLASISCRRPSNAYGRSCRRPPEEFTLYGGTAIALRLGHRASADFDFFTDSPFTPNALLQKVPYLKGATLRRSEPNTLTVTVERGRPVQVSFFGDTRGTERAGDYATCGGDHSIF